MTKNSSNSSKKSGGNTSQISPAKHWIFTFNNYNKNDISSIVPQLDKVCKKYIFQEECGEEGTRHLQGYVEFIDKCRPLSHNMSKKIHWEKCKCPKKAIEYCKKSDTRVGEIFAKKIVVPYIVQLKNPKQWQIELTKILKEEPDYRSIHWIYDKIGNSGKTHYCKWYLSHNNDAIYVSGKSNDIKYAISSRLEEGGNVRVVFIDLPRSLENFVSYQALEEVKNGLFFSGKYESKQIMFKEPHVVCLANFLPTKEAMSLDRWKIKTI